MIDLRENPNADISKLPIGGGFIDANGRWWQVKDKWVTTDGRLCIIFINYDSTTSPNPLIKPPEYDRVWEWP